MMEEKLHYLARRIDQLEISRLASVANEEVVTEMLRGLCNAYVDLAITREEQEEKIAKLMRRVSS
jgi:hypothetical protein